MRNSKPLVGASVAHVHSPSVTLVRIGGLIDENFQGFGAFPPTPYVVLDVSAIVRMTSFGVRQWIKAMEALPKPNVEVYLVGCPTFFIDQMNMVLNFAGPSKVLTATAPYMCPGCGSESSEAIDILAERGNLAKGTVPERKCSKCGQVLEFEESPESYFAFVGKYAATGLDPATAEFLGTQNLYHSTTTVTDKPPRIIKLVHNAVTYFRIIGTLNAMFRSRPLLVGVEGEVVIDLAEVPRFEPIALKEWKRLIKGLTRQVSAVTLVDVNESFLSIAGESLVMARNVAVASVLVPYTCKDCGRTSDESETLLVNWPRTLEDHVCSRCGGITLAGLSADALLPLRKASTSTLPVTSKFIAGRDEMLSRALTDANVAQAGDKASAALSSDDMVLGKYKIVRRLSAGGMAEVFLAKQVGSGGFEKPVALKRIQRKLFDARQQAVELFLNEAKIAGRLTHPNIVQVLDVGEEGGALVMAMEYVHGRDLRRVIRKLMSETRQFPLAEACFIVREVALALDYAYWSNDLTGNQLAVVHRDVSPHNVILGYDGTVKLLDFGVATSSVTEHAEALIVGKWNYMSPEAMTNQQVDHRSDLFSLGIVFYLLCSGAMPFGDPKQTLLQRIRQREYLPLQSLVPLPEPIATLVDRLLHPNPAERPRRGQDVARELADIMRESGMKSSTAEIASFLNKLYADEIGAGLERPIIQELARVSDPSMLALRRSSATHDSQSDRSPLSITPTVGRYSAPMDISETFQASRMMGSGTGSSTGSTDATTVSPTTPPAAAQLAAPSPPAFPAAPETHRGRLLILLVIAATLLACAIYLWLT